MLINMKDNEQNPRQHCDCDSQFNMTTETVIHIST